MATIATFGEPLSEPGLPSRTRSDRTLDEARKELMAQAKLLGRTALELDERFFEAVERVATCRGRVVVTGMGKSGLVARKIASTLACTGTPAFYLHPGEAAHGDLGAVTPEDLVIAVSYSGETGEVVWLLPSFSRLGVALIALTGAPESTLARAADVALTVTTDEPTLGPRPVPTGSALVSQAVGDALALAAMKARGLREEDIAPLHPGSPTPGASRR
ncbi:MAG: SIS domain-containing protein [Polyangiaceae bacterium]